MPARSASGSLTEDTAVSRARAARRRAVTVAIAAIAAVALVAAGATVTRALKNPKRRVEHAVLAATTAAQRPGGSRAEPAATKTVDPPPAESSGEVVSVENLPAVEHPVDTPRRARARAITPAHVGESPTDAASAAPTQRAADQIFLEEEPSQGAAPAEPGKAAPAGKATPAPAKAAPAQPSSPTNAPSDALNNPGF